MQVIQGEFSFNAKPKSLHLQTLYNTQSSKKFYKRTSQL